MKKDNFIKVKNFKKKFLKAGLILIVAGTLITLVGLAQNNFTAAAYAEADGHRWYQTIYLEEGDWSFGVEFNSRLCIPKIGGKNHTFVMLYVGDLD